MIQGTGSHVGKSVLAAALCRIFYREGYRVAPFKSQNMALNSYVTEDGGEMGRAQVVQAEAAGIPPHVDMNPILLKPTGQATSQVIVLGKPIGNLSAREYHGDWTKNAMSIIMGAWERLAEQYQLVVVEGAGSPAEINLKDTEVVNMRVAAATKTPVLLVGDIDKGGVLASLVGTMELLEPEERDMVAGFIINKFRGDVSLFQPAVEFLEQKTGKPVLGVIPYFQGFKVQEEDGQTDLVGQDRSTGRAGLERSMAKVDIAVIRLPHISNFTDFDALGDEPDVTLRYIGKGQTINQSDLVIIPGSKNTIEDLLYLQQSGLAAELAALNQQGTPVIGICGGYQMLGRELRDPLRTESSIESMAGLGLLDAVTVFEPEKITCQVTAEIRGVDSFLKRISLGRGAQAAGDWQPMSLTDCRLTGYEIHMGRTELGADSCSAFQIVTRSGQAVDCADGGISSQGLVLGTYMHGIFDNDLFRRNLINALRVSKGLQPADTSEGLSVLEQRERDYDKLAQVVRDNLNMPLLRRIMGLEE
ncbi:MAG TPA: cobyric acid synthase [Bacillota bacterium]|nr:cobyric acid synthase [Bacillota bacterium]